MRAGSRVLMIAAVALMCAACLLAAACEDDALISPKPMSDYVAEVSDAIGAAIGNGVENGVLGVRLEGDLNAADQSYHVDAGLSWNVDAPSGSAMSFEVTHGGESVIDIYADGSDLYADIDLDSAPWLNGKVKYVNVDIFGYFSEVLDGDDPGDILCALGNAAFDGVDVNANKTVYSFELRKDALARIVDIVGEEFAALGEAESGVVGELFGLQREAEVSGSDAAMSWTFEPKAQLADKSSLSNIYNGRAYLIHGASGGEYVPMSATEAKSDELYLKMDYVDTDGDLHRDSLARIVAIEGLDASSTEIQNVVFKVQYPNMFEGSLLGSLFDGASYALAVEVKDKSGNDVTAEVIDALTLNGVQCEGGRGETTLEEILKNSVPVSITATFDTPGTYEITLYLQKAGSVSGTSVSLHVTVKNGG